MSIRDTQFTGFAKALLKEIVDDMLDEYGFMDRSHYESGDLNTTEELIARRAYDLVEHTIDQITPTTRELWTDRELLDLIPDLTELPKDQDEAEIARQKEIDEILSHGDELDAWELHEKLCNVGLPKEQE